jgi:hypothetical protein
MNFHIMLTWRSQTWIFYVIKSSFLRGEKENKKKLKPTNFSKKTFWGKFCHISTNVACFWWRIFALGNKHEEIMMIYFCTFLKKIEKICQKYIKMFDKNLQFLYNLFVNSNVRSLWGWSLMILLGTNTNSLEKHWCWNTDFKRVFSKLGAHNFLSFVFYYSFDKFSINLLPTNPKIPLGMFTTNNYFMSFGVELNHYTRSV